MINCNKTIQIHLIFYRISYFGKQVVLKFLLIKWYTSLLIMIKRHCRHYIITKIVLYYIIVL